MAGRLITSLAPSPPKPQLGRYCPAPEPRKPVAGWTDGSNDWRSVIYNIAAPRGVKPFTGDVAVKAYGSLSTPARRDMRVSYPTVTTPFPSKAESSSAAEALLFGFNENFARQTQSYSCLNCGSRSPVPITSTHSLSLPSRTHRSLVPSSVEGKLLVPDVKMRIHRAGSSSLRSSACRGHLGASSSSKKNAADNCSSLCLHCDNIGKRSDQVHPRRSVTENSKYYSAFNFSITHLWPSAACSWSYKNVLTYEIMPFPPKKIKKCVKKIIDGVEQDVEIEVEEYPKRKRLFLFPPSQRKFIP